MTILTDMMDILDPHGNASTPTAIINKLDLSIARVQLISFILATRKDSKAVI